MSWHSILEDFICKIESLNQEVKSPEIAVKKLTVNCDKLRQDFQAGNSMQDLECRLLRILDVLLKI